MKSLILSLALLGSLLSFSQEEASNWFFGYGGGLRFEPTGNISAVNSGRLSTNEGCATISDSNGLLLFYTDGRVVYNRQHVVMQNGSGLYGDSSSSQSAIIVPNPQDDTIYYIFTVDNGLDGANFGLNYSIVDISRNSGLGEIIAKNQPMLSFSSEKLTAVRKDCETGNYWVITLSTQSGNEGFHNTYHAFEISETGVNTSSVKSTFTVGQSGQGITDSRGYLIVSPDGTKLISANMQNGLYLYNFDVSSGRVSNQIKLELDTNAPFPYGVAFSPNSQVLYIHSSNDFFQPGGQATAADHFSVLTQFDLNANDIQNSAYIVDDRQLYRGALQLGPDGRIYRALSETYFRGTPYLGTINHPNALGSACEYQHNSVDLSPNFSAQGLPPFIQSFFDKEIDIINNESNSSTLALCENESYTLSAENITDATYTWFKNGQELNVTSSQLIINSEGHYELIITPLSGACTLEGEAFVEIAALPDSIETTLVQCDIDDGDGITFFNLDESIARLTHDNQNLKVSFYESETDALNDTNRLDSTQFKNNTNPQTLYANVASKITGCSTISKLHLLSQPSSLELTELRACDDDGNNDGFYEFNLGAIDSQVPTGAQMDSQVTYYRNTMDALLERNNLPTVFKNEVEGQQRIYSRMDNDNNCGNIRAIDLIVNAIPQIETEASDFYCLNFYPETTVLDAGINQQNSSSFTYLWSTGETSEKILINEPGIYKVEVTNQNGCSTERTYNLMSSNIATVTSVEVVDATNNNTISISVAGEGDYEYSLEKDGPYQDENIFTNVKAGIRTIFIRDKNNCGIVERTVSVIGFPKFFTPNGDGFNDVWQIMGINERFQPNSVIYIYDRYGKLLKQLDPLSKGWDGTFNGNVLPSTDYWFSVELEDGRLYTNHFSLIR